VVCKEADSLFALVKKSKDNQVAELTNTDNTTEREIEP